MNVTEDYVTYEWLKYDLKYVMSHYVPHMTKYNGGVSEVRRGACSQTSLFVGKLTAGSLYLCSYENLKG